MVQIDQLLKGSSEQENPSFESPLELLDSCHDKILQYSSALYKLTQALPAEGWTKQLETSADQIRRYFNVAGPEHHLDEEKHIFPAIIALDPQFTNPESLEMLHVINRLIKEHVETDVLWESLDNMLSERSEDFETLEELAQQFAEDMIEHATIENDVIFPYVKKHLSEKDLKKIGSDIAKRRGVKLPKK